MPPPLIAIVLSQTNKSKYFFPLCESVTFICNDVIEAQLFLTKWKQNKPKKKIHLSIQFVHIYYFDNLYALSVQYRYNTNKDKSEKRTMKAIKERKKKYSKRSAPKELRNKSMIISLSVKRTHPWKMTFTLAEFKTGIYTPIHIVAFSVTCSLTHTS